MKGLFLDDERVPEDAFWAKYPDNIEWIIVRNYNQFVYEIQTNGMPELISFDHDLAEAHYEDPLQLDPEEVICPERTGYDAAKWLVNYCMEKNKKLPQYIVHSMNIVGRKNIQTYLDNYKKHREG